jgi:hypothetical protein
MTGTAAPDGTAREVPFTLPSGEEAAALYLEPPVPRVLLVLGHGAGAGMSHPFLEALARALAERSIATLRYPFPFTARGDRRPDPPASLEATVRAAMETAHALAPHLPLFAGGKSLGGRMTSRAEATAPLGVRGLVFVGFPLHPAKRPGTARAAHLPRVPVPMLFLQGTRDALADLDLLRPVVTALGPRATLAEIAGADHGFAVLRRSGRTAHEVLAELADTAAGWMAGLAETVPGAPR